MKCCTSKKGLLNRFLCLLLSIFMLFGTGTRGFALEGQTASDPRIGGNDLNIWADGVSADLVRYGSRTGAKLSAPEIPREYFYPYIYMSGEYDWTGYGAVAFWISNTGSNPLKINFTLTDLARKDYRLDDLDSIFVLREGESMTELISPVFGLLELEPGFKGEMYIPIGHIPEASLKNVVSFGVTFAVAAGTSVGFEFSDAELISEPMSNSRFRIKGPQAIRIPAIGEAVARYTVDFGGQEHPSGAVFQLEGERQGVSLTGDGILTINEDAQAGYAEIIAISDGTVKRRIPVELLESRQDFGFPKPNEAAMLADVNDPFFDGGILNSIRAACVIIALLLLGLYLWWRKRDRRLAYNEKNQS